MKETERKERIKVLEQMKSDGMCTSKELKELKKLKTEQFYAEY